MKLCQANNLDGENLYYKWEASRFNNGPARAFTIKEIPELRAAIAKSQKKDTPATKNIMRSKLSGQQSRRFAASAGKGGRPILGSQTSTPVKPAARAQDGFDLSRVEEKRTVVAGPSRVTFAALPQDESARKKRACEWFLASFRSELC